VVQHASLHALTEDPHRLSDQLGEEHDLAVLRDLSHQRGIDRQAERSLQSLIRKRRRRLRKRAISLGVPLYAEKSGALRSALAPLLSAVELARETSKN